MEGMGPEAKRQRVEYSGTSRIPSQAGLPPQSHGHPGALPPPHAYQHLQQPPPPPSPYDTGPHEARSLPDPTPHAYVQEHSGHSTPVRDQRFHPEPNYSRRSSASAAVRSPDGQHPFPSSRTLGTAGPPEQYPPPQHQYASEPGGHVSGYPSHDAPLNGNVHHGLPMHPYDQSQAYPPNHAVDYAHSPVTVGPHPYGPPGYGLPYGSGGVRPIKKGNRAQQACDVCRTRKAKCDEGRPECGFCVENNMRCNYQSVAPAKADRANQQIMDQLSSYKSDYRSDLKALQEDWGGRFDKMGGRFDKIESILLKLARNQELTSENLDSKPASLKVESPPNNSAGEGILPAMTNSFSKPTLREQTIVDDSPNASFTTQATEASQGIDAGATSSNAFYIEHDTAAQKLFRWRSIKRLLKQSAELAKVNLAEDYVMKLEMNKGVLRFYGKGRQMRDCSYGSPASASSPTPSATNGFNDDSTPTSSPPYLPESLWGTGLSPPTTEARPVGEIGGLNPDSTLKLEPKTISRLFQSYLNHIHILHPFLEERGLTGKVERFKQRYTSHDPSLPKPTFAVPVAVDNLRDPHRVPKRKHSDGQYYGATIEPVLGPSPMSSKIQLERSPSTALILLVMALGLICECREPLPGPVPGPGSDNLKETNNAAVHPYSPIRAPLDSPPPAYPMRHSPSSSSQSTSNTSAPSPLGVNRYSLSSPRSSIPDLLAGSRNVDVIPGLAYYAQATEILGNLTGYQELINAQCCLLAGLYAGQLANSLESLTWIQTAGRICRFLVKEPNYKLLREPKKNQVNFAFWTSLQLESDILAELDIPPSGMQDVQEEVLYPSRTMGNDDTAEDGSPRAYMMIYYSFQLYIRKLLNNIQKELYQEKDPTFARATRSSSLRNAFNAMIEDWRARLPEPLQWEDTLPNSHINSNINDARLRGKFYAAQYIIHRPFLHAALEYDFNEPPETVKSPISNATGSQSQSSNLPAPCSDMGPPKSSSEYEKRRSETIALAVTCINAAIRSTTAFDGIIERRRMVVTNIMGTAHAQFGNLLVLSAAFKSKTMGKHIKEPTLQHLFDRTIKLLAGLAPISQTLGRDCYILKELRKVVFEGGDVVTSSGEVLASSSFSSE